MFASIDYSETMSVVSSCVISCLCLVILLPCYDFCLNITFNYDSTTSDLKDQVCSSSATIIDVNLASDLQCSYLCATDATCGSFFYHQEDQICVTCNDVYVDLSNLVSYHGMSYYIPEQVMASFRRWSEWTPWSLCTATCHQGIRMRTRTCNDTATRCKGDALQTETCNKFSCTPLASTCTEWASRGLYETRDLMIDPDGNGTTFSGVTVPCDLDSEPGRAITVLHHNNETPTYVDGFELFGSYEVILSYTVGIEAAKRIADISSHCRQYVKWDCHKASMFIPGSTEKVTAWKNRSMMQSSYFTGPYQSGKYCHCGDQGTCLDQNLECNCDLNAPNWSFDEGNVTLKSDLPMYSFMAGNTGSVDEFGWHTIGPLLCW